MIFSVGVILHNTGDMLRLLECKVLYVYAFCSYYSVCILTQLVVTSPLMILVFHMFLEQEEKEEEEESDLGESRIP